MRDIDRLQSSPSPSPPLTISIPEPPTSPLKEYRSGVDAQERNPEAPCHHQPNSRSQSRTKQAMMSLGNNLTPSPTAQKKRSPLRNPTRYFTMPQLSLRSPLNGSTCANSVTGHLRPLSVCGVTSRAIRKSAELHICSPNN